MANPIVEALASSSAHGISRAAATNSNLLRVVWIIFFLFFLGLFCNSARTLVNKLSNLTVTTTIQADRVPFAFPDIYICPANPISGSYPYALNDAEATLVNEEIERLGKIYDSLEDRHYYKSYPKEIMIFRSASPEVMKLLCQRQKQSLAIDSVLFINSATSTVMYPINRCFKLTASTYLAKIIGAMSLWEPKIQLRLFTDPFNSHFLYNGSQIKPISYNNNSIPIHEWHLSQAHQEDVTAMGYTLYLVPPGHFPSTTEASVLLNPGQLYEIVISMEEVVYSEELYGQSCKLGNDKLAVFDPITENMVEYENTLMGNFYTNRIRDAHQIGNYVLSDYPIPWELRHSKRLLNLSNHLIFSDSSRVMKAFKDAKKPDAYFLSVRPCHFQRYKVSSLSSNKWPILSGNSWNAFRRATKNFNGPAIDQLVNFSRNVFFNSGNHSAHLESMLQNFIANTMLKVNIRAQSRLSPLIEIAYSYSWTSFLSDIGGLLGLYIGCSMLTLCELFELVYTAVFAALNWKRTRNSQPRDDNELTAVEATDANPQGEICTRK